MLEGQIGFIGAGQMARALARGFVARSLITPDRILAFDPEPQALQQLTSEVPQARVLSSNSQVVDQSTIVILAVKPQSFPAVVKSLDGQSTAGRLFVSILAGVPLSALQQGLKTNRIARVMPNTPCLVGQGAAGYAFADPALEQDAKVVEQLFSSVGIAFSVPERLLNAVTGLSGSGPAYVYMMIESLSDGGVRMGLPRQVATQLAAQTVLGAAQMVLATGEHPGVLKDRVASPAGTTIAGLQVLEKRGVRSAFIDAVEAATVRSQELGT